VGLGEDVVVASQEGLEHLLAGDQCERRWGAAAETHPENCPTVAPKGHGQSVEVPGDGAQGAQPVHAEHQVEAIQVQGEAVQAKRLAVDGSCSGRAQTGAGHAFAIGDSNGETRPRRDGEAQPGNDVGVDERESRPRVDQGHQVDACDADLQLHGVRGRDASQRIQGDADRVIIIGSRLILFQFQEKDSRVGAPVIFGELFKAEIALPVGALVGNLLC